MSQIPVLPQRQQTVPAAQPHQAQVVIQPQAERQPPPLQQPPVVPPQPNQPVDLECCP